MTGVNLYTLMITQHCLCIFGFLWCSNTRTEDITGTKRQTEGCWIILRAEVHSLFRESSPWLRQTQPNVHWHTFLKTINACDFMFLHENRSYIVIWLDGSITGKHILNRQSQKLSCFRFVIPVTTDASIALCIQASQTSLKTWIQNNEMLISLIKDPFSCSAWELQHWWETFLDSQSTVLLNRL